MTEERLSDEALALAGQRPELLRDLLKPISLNHSAEAERLIRKQLPLDRDLQQGNRNEYRFVAMWIEQYRNVSDSTKPSSRQGDHGKVPETVCTQRGNRPRAKVTY